jgi:antitoxin (DNA-binding transcriptional repressor) of toxin-antitoxin stability system
MHCVTVEDAQTNLSQLISSLHPGEVVQIISGQTIVAQLMAGAPIPRQPRQPGSAVGTLTIVADNDDHLHDFKDYMP